MDDLYRKQKTFAKLLNANVFREFSVLLTGFVVFVFYLSLLYYSLRKPVKFQFDKKCDGCYN